MEILKIQKREANEDVNKLRAEGIVPAVLYGPKQEVMSVKLSSIDFNKVYRVAGESAIIMLSVDDGKEEHEALIHDISVDAVKGKVLHIDFYVIEVGKELSIDVPIVFTGESKAEKSLGGILVRVLHELSIKARPKDLPHDIQVSLDSLTEIGSQIHVKDIVLPTGVSLDESDPEEVVAVVQVAKEENFEQEAPSLDSIEVVGAKKKEEVSSDSK